MRSMARGLIFGSIIGSVIGAYVSQPKNKIHGKTKKAVGKVTKVINELL